MRIHVRSTAKRAPPNSCKQNSDLFILPGKSRDEPMKTYCKWHRGNYWPGQSKYVSSNCFNTSLPLLNTSDLHANIAPSETTPESIESLLCTEEEVLHLLEMIDVSKSSGSDGISDHNMLKETATSIAAPVTKLFNLSISTGIFPDKWKLSSVVPIPKSVDKGNLGNYRPISLLPVLSKLLERHIFSLLFKHLDQSHPISDRISAWKVNYYCFAGDNEQLVPTSGKWRWGSSCVLWL